MSKIISPKIAIILFNLGGPSDLDSVEKFLFNLFYDPSIIRLPNPFRWIIAKLISKLRNKKAQEIYKKVGNKSPILEETIFQKNALIEELKSHLNEDFEIFICMRHWHPMSFEIVNKVEEFNPDQIILLPLYPQFSTTTTGSSIKEFSKYLKLKNIKIEPKIVCCYPIQDNFINAHVNLIKKTMEQLKNKDNFKILFSAHGLPKKIIEEGDPYQWQIEQTVKAIVKMLQICSSNYKITYQSRVGPVEWLKPNTDEEIEKAAKEKKSLIIIPIAFVSEHVETLVELDIDYKEIAHQFHTEYLRVPTLSINESYIKSMRNMIQKALKSDSEKIISCDEFKCPKNFINCPRSLKSW